MTTELLNTFTDVESIFIVGRRWFEKTNGNTYHSAEVFVNNQYVGKVAYTYGYGDQYLWSGLEFLVKGGYLKNTKSGYSALCYVRENNITLNHTVSDVKRKKDL